MNENQRKKINSLISEVLREELDDDEDSGGPQAFQTSENVQEITEDALEETSTSGATPGYMTPFAFQPGTGKEAIVRKQLGIDPDDFTPVPMGDKHKKLSEARSRYLDFKMQEGSPPQKIGRAIHEINKRLDEIDHFLEMNQRLKTENNLGSTSLWKRTTKHLTRMENKMLRMSHRIKELMA